MRVRVQIVCRWVRFEEGKKQVALNVQRESKEAKTYLEIRSEGQEILI